jgi:hypothetical protein
VVRCPRCQHDNGATALYCDACRHRLFAWLGDPFGNLEPSGEPVMRSGPWAPARPAASTSSVGRTGQVAAPSTTAGSGFPFIKATVAGVFALFVLASAPLVVKLLLIGAIVSALLVWPGMGWLAFLGLLCGAGVTVTLVLAQVSP